MLTSNRSPMLRRVAGLTLLALVGVPALASCNRGGDTSGSSASGGAEKVKVAIVTRNFANPYWAAMRDGAVDQGKEMGVEVDVQAGADETDAAGENQKISTMANQDYTCFGVVPVDDTNVITPLVSVAKQKIPILNLDSKISDEASKAAGVSYESFIGSDNVNAGRIAGKAILDTVPAGSQVAILQGIAGEQNGINREKGFKETVGDTLTVVQEAPADYEQDKGLQVASAILKAHPDLKAIFAANDNMGLGAATAISNAGLAGKVKIVSVDGIGAALDAVKAGTLTGTVTQYPYTEGQLAVQGCVALVEGKKIPARIVAPIALIDASNVDKAKAAAPKPFTPFDNPLTSLTT